MSLPDELIINLLKSQTVLTLSTSVENKPYSCNCYYAYDAQSNYLICASSYDTKHIKDIDKNNYISGTIYKHTKIIGQIAGIQFNGYIREAKGNEYTHASKIYIGKFPFAALHPSPLWIIEPTFIKLTDTKKLGFGKKLIWEKNQEK